MSAATTTRRRAGRVVGGDLVPMVVPADAARLPMDVDAEMAVLGSILIDGVMFETAARVVSAEHFARPSHAAVWRAMESLYRRGDAIDVVTVRGALETAGELDLAGGAHSLTLLAERVPTAMHAAHYATIVRRRAEQRRMIAAAGEIARLGHDGGEDALDRAKAILARMDADIDRAESGDVGDALADLMAPRPDGWSTGIGVLDHWLGDVGLVPSRMLVLTGKSGVGKTWLATSAAMSALGRGARVVFFSIEMTRAEVLVRMAAPALGGRVFRLLRSPATWSDHDRDTLREMVARFDGVPLYVYERQDGAFDIAAIARKHGADVVVVDWYQQLSDAWAEPGTGSDMIDHAHALALLNVARRGGACVIVVSQLNRDGTAKYGAWLNAYASAHVILKNVEDTPGRVVLEPVKNRWGTDSAGGASAEFQMDKATGRLTPVGRPGDARTEVTPW